MPGKDHAAAKGIMLLEQPAADREFCGAFFFVKGLFTALPAVSG